jgi:hypothetical protein
VRWKVHVWSLTAYFPQPLVILVPQILNNVRAYLEELSFGKTIDSRYCASRSTTSVCQKQSCQATFYFLYSSYHKCSCLMYHFYQRSKCSHDTNSYLSTPSLGTKRQTSSAANGGSFLAQSSKMI